MQSTPLLLSQSSQGTLAHPSTSSSRLCYRGVRFPRNECLGQVTKQSDGKVPVMLELWEMQSTPLLLSHSSQGTLAHPSTSSTVSATEG